ncbi:hypothetical protein AB4Y87_23430 [Paenarthrobacter sp. RAF54_2]|uniref:hypothetical protein n=1 Tax=Paenarthrobacter sp. RAF54_2 TaxID=3233061 RepID=UPI003F9D8165
MAAPSPAASVAPTSRARSKYPTGLKKFWRGGVPSDEILLKPGGAACSLVAEGKHWFDIAGMAGPDGADMGKAAATATSASRNLCTKYKTAC